MPDVVIRAEALGKRYLIGHETERESYVALRDVIARTARSLVRSAGNMMRGRQLVTGNEIEEFWALKDIDFEIRRGEVVGIIGRNGAGKSTLLKILSRITEPTAGRVEIIGRVASLLEVGTGFHPELTGRENIFLNGAILGMSRAEIRRKFDEIVAFAEVEKFLDTPVKRYSSGMYVRLAFAVAAHLDPEILIVDEVLAVGDAEFQKKCLGKMKDVAGGGRTVLFVSHNLAAVQTLCSSALLMSQGKVTMCGAPQLVINEYLRKRDAKHSDEKYLVDAPRTGEGNLRFRRMALLDANNQQMDGLVAGGACRIALEIEGRVRRGVVRAGLTVSDSLGRPLILFANEVTSHEPILVGRDDWLICEIPKLPLTEGSYLMTLFLEVDGVIEDWVQEALSIDVAGGSFFGTARNAPSGWNGRTVLVEHRWSVMSWGELGQAHDSAVAI